MDIIQLSIPIFIGLVILELLVLLALKRPYIRLNDSVSDMACGILSQVVGIFSKGVQLYFYYLVWNLARVQHLGLPEVPTQAAMAGWWPVAAAWFFCFMGVDLAYYWYHRKAHEVNILWALTHIVHHQSEEYNLTVALRQSAFGGFLSWVFYLPLALLGFPWEMMAACYAINLIYQFWIHTRLIGKMPRWIESVWNTPSHHRVHHGRNPKYIDRNYAGVFIIWDRWFGTYQVEEEEPVYGITKPLNSWNPIWANFHAVWDILRDAASTKSWRAKWKLFLAPPGFKPADLGGPGPDGGFLPIPEVDRATAHNYDPPAPRGVQWYVFVQFVLLLPVAITTFALKLDEMPMEIAIGGFFIALTLVNLGGLLESKAWAFVSEVGRLTTAIVVGALAAFTLPQYFIYALALLGLAAASGLWVLALQKKAPKAVAA